MKGYTVKRYLNVVGIAHSASSTAPTIGYISGISHQLIRLKGIHPLYQKFPWDASCRATVTTVHHDDKGMWLDTGLVLYIEQIDACFKQAYFLSIIRT